MSSSVMSLGLSWEPVCAEDEAVRTPWEMGTGCNWFTPLPLIPAFFPFEKRFTNPTLTRFTVAKYHLYYYLHNIFLMKVNPPLFFPFLLKAFFNATLYHYHKWKRSIDVWPYIDSNHKNKHNENKTMLLSSSCLPLACCSLRGWHTPLVNTRWAKSKER